jgi:multisubunit Na+/H+ antiporter MnhB subunit
MDNTVYKLLLFLLAPAIAGLIYYYVNRYFNRLLRPREKTSNLILYFLIMIIVGSILVVGMITLLLKAYLFLQEID